MSKLAIVSGKGGVGKTTLALNLGYLLHNKFNRDTTIVDCNLTTPHLTINLGSYSGPVTLNHVLRGQAKLGEAIVEHPVGIKLVPASLDLKELDGVDISALERVLKSYESNLILDSAPGLGREGVASIAASDEILFLTQPYTSAVVDIFRTRKVAEVLNKKVLGVVVNSRRGMRHELTNNEIEKICEVPVVGEIPFDIEIEKSQASKLPLALYNPAARANHAFYEVSSNIAGYPIQPPKTFLERLFERIGL
ncbi:MAG: P-loop NTPase [Candidatus Aenigmarchaeota archaeon]|nr:P-loop NTPase [Candidatus Aenigmarchaeota archaeon]